MPNSKSAEKRLRQNATRRIRNRSVKSALRTQLRKVQSALDAGDVNSAETEFREAAKQLDQVIHINRASRTKSRLQKRIKMVKHTASSK
jgi:small subunit ribosomal protein S20